MPQIKIRIGELELKAVLYETECAKEIYERLPIRARFNTWGDEIYFEIPVKRPLDHTAKEVVEVGDLGYWPQGKAFCIFYGKTPISTEDKIIPASAVNVVGRVLDPTDRLKGITLKGEVVLERVLPGEG